MKPGMVVQDSEPGRTPMWGIGALHALWQVARFALLAVLRFLDPVLRVILSALGLLSLFTALFFATVARLPTRSLIVLVGFGVACAMARVLYEKLLRLLSR